MRVDRAGVVHVGDQFGEHAVGLVGFALQVGQHLRAALGGDHVDLDGVALAEPPAASDGLIPLLIGVRREIGHSVAMLPVQSPRPDRRFGYQHPDVPRVNAASFFLFRLGRLGPGDFDCAVDQFASSADSSLR